MLLICFTKSVLRIPKLFVFAALACAAAGPSRAGESPFGWIYTAEVAPPGTKEFEQWFDLQRQQAQGSYTNVRLRTEIEFGITSK